VALHVMLMGPPQAGKGTQAQTLANRFGLLHLATGDLLRDISQEDTDRGRLVGELLQRGDYVPDDLVTQLVAERTGDHGVVLDGFPRTIAQAESLDRLGIPVHTVLVLAVPAKELIARAQDRLFCPNCSAIYAMRTNPPRVPWICDVCGHGLAQRMDDAPATVRRRLQVYKQRSEPVVRFYERRGLVQRIDGIGPIDTVAAALADATARVMDRVCPAAPSALPLAEGSAQVR